MLLQLEHNIKIHHYGKKNSQKIWLHFATKMEKAA